MDQGNLGVDRAVIFLSIGTLQPRVLTISIAETARASQPLAGGAAPAFVRTAIPQAREFPAVVAAYCRRPVGCGRLMQDSAMVT